MKNQDPPAPSDEQMQKLAHALADMRDALVDASLVLKDMQFELDVGTRRTIEENCDQLLKKLKK